MNKIKKTAINISSIFVLFFQYLPTASYYFGIMSIPFFVYLGLFLKSPLANQDIKYWPLEYSITILAILFSVYCWIYLYRHRDEGLVSTGPYKYIRHPQYIAVIIAITVLSCTSYFKTSPLDPLERELYDEYWIIIIWGVEIGFYLFLTIIEDLSLKKEFPQYSEYTQQTWRFFPKFYKSRKNNEQNLIYKPES